MWVLCAALLAAGVRGGSPGLLLAGAVLAAGNVVSLYLWPLAPCLACKGTGRNKGSSKRRFGQCRRCDASGKKIRPGARTVHRGAVTLAQKARARKKGK